MSPKQRFLRQKQLSETFHQMVSTIEFEEGSDAALLQFMDNLSLANDPQDAVARNFKLEGAKLFLAVLLAIGRPEEQPEREPIGVLKKV